MEKKEECEDEDLRLTIATADDGDWSDVAPETVHTLKAYLKTDRFAVLTTEDHPEDLINEVEKAFRSKLMKDSDSLFLELGTFKRIPAVRITDEIVSVYFSYKNRQEIEKILNRQKWDEESFISLPESPPVVTAKIFEMLEVRVWVPMVGRKNLTKFMNRAFEGYRPILRNDLEMLWVPGEAEENIFTRLDDYFECIAICVHDGSLDQEGAESIALRQLKGDHSPIIGAPGKEGNHV